MPLYEYKCSKGHITSKLRAFSDNRKNCLCDICGTKAEKIISIPNLVTDTNFGYTGKYDNRLGGPKIEGRKDFWNRVKQKNLKEVDLRELANNPSTLEKRLKKLPPVI